MGDASDNADDWYARYRREVEFAHRLKTEFRINGIIECQIIGPMPRRLDGKTFYQIKLDQFEVP